MANMNPFGESGLIFAGIGQVIVVLAITLFIQIKKRYPKIPLKTPLLIVGLHNIVNQSLRLH